MPWFFALPRRVRRATTRPPNRAVMTTLAGTLLAAAAATACAGGSPSPARAPTPAAAQTYGVLRAEDLERSFGASLYERVSALRPSFVTNRGAPTTVFVNGMYFGPVTALRDIPVGTVRQIRLLSAPEATVRFGSFRQTGAALEVILRTGVR